MPSGRSVSSFGRSRQVHDSLLKCAPHEFPYPAGSSPSSATSPGPPTDMEVSQVGLDKGSQRMAHGHLGRRQCVSCPPTRVQRSVHQRLWLSVRAYSLPDCLPCPSYTPWHLQHSPGFQHPAYHPTSGLLRTLCVLMGTSPSLQSCEFSVTCQGPSRPLSYCPTISRLQGLSRLQAFAAWLAFVAAVGVLQVAFVYACRVSPNLSQRSRRPSNLASGG